MSKDAVSILQFDTKHGIGQWFNDPAFYFDWFFLRHKTPFQSAAKPPNILSR
jgi:hypothetical protein